MNDEPMTDFERWHLLELCERSLTASLTPVEKEELNARLRHDAEARSLFAAALQQHAELKFDTHLLKQLADESPPALSLIHI